MRKISTLAFMAFFCCMSAMAQVVLGDIKFSVKDGAKLNPTTGKITVTFPDVTGVEDPTASTLFIAGNFGPENDFDAEGTLASGITIDFADDYGLEPGTEYTLAITSVKVDGTELAAEGGYKLNFKTRGTERKMSWSFVIDEDTKAKIIADDGNDPAYNESNGGNFWKCIKADERHYVHQSLKDSEIMLDAENVFPMAEDLTFNAGADKLFVGDLSGSFKGMSVFNATNLKMTIPDCKVGDVITFSGVNATKGNSSKQTCIYTLNGDAFAPEGLESSRGFVDSVWVSAKGSFKFEAQIDGDISFYFGNFRMTGIEIAEAQPKVARKYNIVAAYTEDETTTTLKELVAQTEGITGSTVKVNYPFWLADAEGNAYTHGARGAEFVESFDLKNGEGDTTFVVNYNKTAFSGVVFLSEGEDLTGATLCGSNNAVVRSSMGKSAYFAEDVNLCTLQPGTYKIRAVLFDASSTPGYSITLTKGAGEENEIYLTAALVNFSEVETELIEITEATNITLKAGGNDTTGLDAIMIYASTDAPEDPDGISEVKDAKKVVARKVAKDGRILIQTAAGTFNAIGVQVK